MGWSGDDADADAGPMGAEWVVGDAGVGTAGVVGVLSSWALLVTMVTSGGSGSLDERLACRVRYRPRARDAANSLVPSGADAADGILAAAAGVGSAGAPGSWLLPVMTDSQSLPRSKPSLQ